MFWTVNIKQNEFHSKLFVRKEHAIVPYFVQDAEIIDNVIFGMMHYELFYMCPSNDGIAVVKDSDQRGMDLNT